MRALLIEPNGPEDNYLERALRDAGFDLDRASSTRDVNTIPRSGRYVILILDLGKSIALGAHIVASLRRRGTITPILALVATNTSIDKVGLLDAGADDCLAKPFHSIEFVARCNALIRRSGLTALSPNSD
ncbi:response regulator [Paraburkholderia sediminicola]|uniref:response regulator n=1 Tax=Paraburkholderia sediminicola TaxID=458836 RepID=UPI0038BC364D